MSSSHDLVRPRLALLVEDSESDARLVREQLRSASPHDWSVETVSTLVALRQRGADADVILLDLNLPDSTGLATFDAVRKAAPHTAIVILTGTEDKKIASEAIRRGAQDYVIKGDDRITALPYFLDWAVMREARISRGRARGALPVVLNREEGLLVADHLERLRPRTGLNLLLLVIEMLPVSAAGLPPADPVLIRAFGELIVRSFREGDVIAHLEGYRFMVVMVNDVREDPTARLRNDLAQATAEGIVPEVRLATGGVSPTVEEHADIETLLGLASLMLGPR